MYDLLLCKTDLANVAHDIGQQTEPQIRAPSLIQLASATRTEGPRGEVPRYYVRRRDTKRFGRHSGNVEPFCPGQLYNKVIDNYEQTPLSNADKKSIMLMTCRGLEHVHTVTPPWSVTGPRIA